MDLETAKETLEILMKEFENKGEISKHLFDMEYRSIKFILELIKEKRLDNVEYVELVLVNGDIEYVEYEGNFNRDYLMKCFGVLESTSGYLIPVDKIVKYKVSKKKQWKEKKTDGKLNKSNDDITCDPFIKFDKDMKEGLSKVFEELIRDSSKDKKPYI